MIDWVKAVVPVKHRVLCDGHGLVVDRDGLTRREWLTPFKVKGSYESSVTAKTQMLSDCLQYGTELYIDGNPSKFLQGHNVVGSDNVSFLVAETVKRILEFDGQEIDPFSYNRILQGDFIIHRLDINYMFELPSHSDVRAWLQAAAVQSKLTYRGKPKCFDESVYWGIGSQLWFAKAYDKYSEIKSGKKGHALPYELQNSPLLDYTRSKLRIELQFNPKGCARIAKLMLGKPNIKKHSAFTRMIESEPRLKGSMITTDTVRELFNEYVGRIEMNSNVVLRPDNLDKCPSAYRGTYAAWLTGHNMRDFFESRATFYRHRKAIKQAINVDISLPFSFDEEQVTNVVPLVRVLEAKPASIPEDIKRYCVGV